MTDFVGRVDSVFTRHFTAALEVASSAGSSTLTVTDGTDLDEFGQLLTPWDGTVYNYEYDGDVTVTLAAPLTSDAAQGETLIVWDPAKAAPVVDTVAHVVPLGDGVTEDVVEARVSYPLIPLLGEGIRDEDNAEAVTVREDSDAYVVAEVLGQAAAFSEDFVVDHIEPILAPTEPPASSPAVAVHGTADSLVVEVVEEYASTTVLDFHVSREEDFEPSELTLAASGLRSPVLVITEETIDDAAGEGEPGTEAVQTVRLALGTNYHVRVVARNDLGAAEPGPIASAQLDPSTVSEVVAARVVSGFVLAGSIQAGNITMNPETGITIPLSSGGVIHFPADGTPGTVDAYVHARGLSVENDLSIRGYGEVNGEMVFTSGVTTPTSKPTIAWGWPAVEPAAPIGTSYDVIGTTNAVGRCVAARRHSAGFSIVEFDPVWGTVFSNTDVDMPIGFPEDPRLWRSHAPIAWAKFNDEAILVTQGPPQGFVPPDSGGYGYSPNWWIWRIDTSTNELLGYRYHGSVPTLSEGDATMLYGDEPAIVELYDDGDFNRLKFTGYRWEPSTGEFVVEKVQNLPSWATTLSHPDIRVTWADAPDGGGQFLAVASEDVGGPIRVFDRPNGSSDWSRNTSRDMQPPGGLYPVNGMVTRRTNLSGGTEQYQIVCFDSSGTVRMLATQRWTPVTLNARYTWYDGDEDGGVHESLPSPAVEGVPIPNGQWPIIVAPPAPDLLVTDPTRVNKANRHGIYVSVDGNPPRRMTYLPLGKNGTSPGDLDPGFDRTGNSSTAMGLPVAEPLVPTTDGFEGTDADPAVLHSKEADDDGPLWRFSGDGSWRLGNLSSDDGGWTPIPLRSGFTAQSGEVPSYRRIGSVVYLRGRVNIGTTVGTGNTPFGDLPEGFRPALSNEIWPTMIDSTVPARFFVNSSGVMNVNRASGSAATGNFSISTSFLID